MASGLPGRVRWRLDGTEFNGAPDELGREWVIETEDGWSSSPPVRDPQAQARTGAHGAWPAEVYRDPRTIKLEGWVYAPTPEARRDAEHRLAALCATPDQHYELVCTEETGERFATVTQDDTTLVSIQPGGRWLDFSLQLTAPDPRKYSTVEQTAATGLPADSATGLDFTAGGGAGLDYDTNGTGLDFGPQPLNHTGRATATNTGTADTAPVLTLTGPLLPPIMITRPDNNASITYHDPITPGQQLTIDTERRTVLLGTPGSAGTNRRHHTTITDWHALAIPPETTTDYTLRHAGGPHTDAHLTVAWRSAWW